MVSEIPSAKKEKDVCFKKPKRSLYTGINKFKRSQATEFLERHTYVKKGTEIMQGANIFDKNLQKFKQTQNFRHQVLWRYPLIK